MKSFRSTGFLMGFLTLFLSFCAESAIAQNNSGSEKPEAIVADSILTSQVPDSIAEQLDAIYRIYDSIAISDNLLFRLLGWTYDLINKPESALAFGPLSLDLAKMINLSRSRGWYFGLATFTNDRFSQHLRLNGFFGYWTRAKYFDYGGGLKWLIDKQRQTELGLRFTNRSDALGKFGDFSEDRFLLSENDYKYNFYENVSVRKKATELQFSTRFARHFKAYLNLSSIQKRYIAHYYHVLPDSLSEARFSNAEIKLRFAYDEKFISGPDGLQSLGTVYPIVWISYEHSFPMLGGQFEFDRVQLEATQNIYTPYMGVAKVVLQLGYASKSCPVMETFNILGSNEPLSLYAPGSFSTMGCNENDVFFCDRFVALYLSHNFSGMLWRPTSQWFQPELTVATNIGWGDMRRAKDFPDKNFKTMEKGYFESGFVVKGLLNLPMVKVGLGAFYRYGPYAFDNVWDNFAFKWSATFSL